MVPPHLVLEKALARYQELGILGNLQHIELGEVVPLGMDELPQRNGQIDISAIKSGDAFDATGRDKLLRKIGFDKVALKAISDSDKDILFTENLEKIQEKVQEFNLQIKQEQQAIIEVANYYEVPILASPDRRSGHATGVLVDPSGTQNKLSVNENGIIIRTTALESIDPPKQPAAVRPIPSQSLSPEERVAFSQEPKIDEGNNKLHPKKSADVDIGSIPVIPLNESARVMLKQDPDLSLNVRGGIMSNAIQDQADVDKGMLLINGSYTVADALQDALLKGRMGKSDLGKGCIVPFVIFASNKTGSQEQELIAKTVTLNNVETPVFFAPNRLENLPDLFTGKLHIKQHQIMPKNPLVLDEISNSSPKERHEETWPIMSTSKAFCGALLTSSAKDFFGEKGVEATVRESLDNAKEKYPGRTEKIDELISALTKSGTTNLKIASILNHTTGLNNNNDAYNQNPPYQAPDKNTYFSEMRIDPDLASKFNYSNNGYYLLEELVNLTSKKGYNQEMQDRIISPLDLTSTKFLKDTPTEERSKIGNSAFLTKDRENPFIVSNDYESTYPIRELSAAAGGLVSSAKDLEKFFTEYTKMILGFENKITKSTSPENADLYRKYLTPETNVSLGTMLKEDNGKILICHDGGHAGNSCKPFIKVDAGLQNFKEGNIKEEQILNFEFTFKKVSALGDLLKYRLLFDVLEDYFSEKISNLGNPQQEEIKSALIPDQIRKLKALGKLPENFSSFERKILEITNDKFFKYLETENLLDKKGVVDDLKLKEYWESNKADFCNKVLNVEAKSEIGKVLKECDQEVSKNSESKQNFFEGLNNSNQRKIDALDLQYPKKPSPGPEKSYVEKMVGKSRDGYNEI